jgi:hypothetical protein
MSCVYGVCVCVGGGGYGLAVISNYTLCLCVKQIEMEPSQCGECLASEVAHVMVISQLRNILRAYELLNVLKSGNIRQFLALLELTLSYAKQYNVTPYQDLEDSIILYQKLFKLTFAHFEIS